MAISGSEQYELLDQLAEEFAGRFRRGEHPDLNEYTDRYPELADDIRELFPAMVRVEEAEAARPGGEEEQRVTGDSPAANPSLPGQIGDYRILREIGRGGMGVVYEAEQISLGRRVALKVLPGQLSGDRLTQERFRREARAAARLHHTNIVPVYDVGQDGDVRYYAMQFIEGQGLDAVITELRRLMDRARSQSKITAVSGGRLHWPRDEHSGQATEAKALAEGVEVSPVLRYILTGRFGPGVQSPELAGVSQPMQARARPQASRHRLGPKREVERPDPTPHWRALRPRLPPLATQTARKGRIRPPQPCHRRPRRRQARRSCPGVPSSRRSSRVSGRSSAAWRRLAGRSPGVSPTPTHGGSCTGTSSRLTCSWIPKRWSGSRISAWPKGKTRG